MWCRTILTAVAISYVICMLLLSGLQKEDLDANTLEKLGRHNVNMDDMNNEQRRQECLLDSYSLKANEKHVRTEVQTEAIGISSTNKSVENDINVGAYPKIEMRVAPNVEDKTVVQHEVNFNETKHFFYQLPKPAKKMASLPPAPTLNNIIREKDEIENLENVTKHEENNGLQIEHNIRNQPDVERVMNFWSKLTRYTKTVVTKLPTTPALPNINTEKNVTTSVKIESHNNGYVHSREMEYFSRILAGYLASQTVPTTTQGVSTKKVYTNYVPGKNEETSKLPAINEEPNNLVPTKNSEQPLNEQNSTINHFTRNDMHFNDVKYNFILDETESMPFKVMYDSTQLTKTIQETPYSQTLKYETKSRGSKPVKRDNSIRFLNSRLQIKNEYNINGELVPDTESTTTTINLLSNQGNEQQEKSETENYANNNKSKNFNQNQNVIINNDQFKSGSVETETWQPIQSSMTTNKQSKVWPTDQKEIGQAQKFSMYEHFKAATTNIDNAKRIKTFDGEPTNKLEQKQFFYVNNNRIKFGPANFEMENYRFQPMLTSIKNAKLNKKSRTTNNQLMVKRTKLNNLEQVENVGLHGGQFEPLSPATDKSGRSRFNKINYYQFNAEPSEIIRNVKQHSNDLNDNQLKNMAPVIKNTVRIQDSTNQMKPIPESINNYERDNEQLIPVNVNNVKHAQHFGMNMYEPQAIPANIIKEIADKVKQIVLKAIEKEVTTTTVSTVSSSTTTAVPTGISITSPTTTMTTTEKPSTILKEITEANQVIQKLMEIFKELKSMKETTKLTSQMQHNSTTASYGTTKLPQLPAQTYPMAFNPYIIKTPPILKPIQVSPYAPNMVSVPMSSVNPPQKQAAPYLPPLNMQPKNDYHSGAITIQTNADEIAPLAIQISKPLKLINQHIVVTTKGSVDKLKEEHERESKKRIEERFRSPTEARNQREKLKLQSDITNNVRVADNLKRHEFRDRYTYKSKFIKDREKPWHNHQYNEKIRHIEESNHPGGSRFSETLNYPGTISHLNELDRPRGLSNSDGLTYVRGLGRPGFNKPGSHQNRMNNLDAIRQVGSYGHSHYGRQPRYEATKFHEKLERSENWPRNTWEDFRVMSTDHSCDEISARQQMPLTKVKQRTRFDDTHFTNFLKSQQKVTDMLEKILANNIKNSGPRSVETE